MARDRSSQLGSKIQEGSIQNTKHRLDQTHCRTCDMQRNTKRDMSENSIKALPNSLAIPALRTRRDISIQAIRPRRARLLPLSSSIVNISTKGIVTTFHFLRIPRAWGAEPTHVSAFIGKSSQLGSSRPHCPRRCFWLRLKVRRAVVARCAQATALGRVEAVSPPEPSRRTETAISVLAVGSWLTGKFHTTSLK